MSFIMAISRSMPRCTAALLTNDALGMILTATFSLVLRWRASFTQPSRQRTWLVIENKARA